MPTICIYEVFKRLSQQFEKKMALDASAFMRQGTVVDLTTDLAISAATLSKESKLAMADSVILATARAYNATIWTQDADFSRIAGVRYIPKRQSKKT